MNPTAIVKARARLSLASKTLVSLRNCPDYDEFQELWYTFLMAAKAVYTILEQGAKYSPQSRQWFGGKKNERRGDPLLQYLFIARDDAEHGLNEVTHLHPGGIALGVNKPGFSRHMSFEGIEVIDGELRVASAKSYDGKPIGVEITLPHARLVPVSSRGVTYHPPCEHLGNPLADNLPITVGDYAATYLKRLIEEAEKLFY